MMGYTDNGVRISPELPKPERPIKLSYNGLLAQNGAAEVVAHVGFNEWKDIRDYRMAKTPDGFETFIMPPYNADTVSICFRDAGNHWDNISGDDYNYSVANESVANELSRKSRQPGI